MLLGSIWESTTLLFIDYKCNKRVWFLLSITDIYSKYVWAVSLKDQKGITITNNFQKLLDRSRRRRAKFEWCKPNKIWVDKVSEFYKRSMKSWLQDDI